MFASFSLSIVVFFLDFDDGESLRILIETEKYLFQNNFPQVILAHAASAIAANYQQIVEDFDGCSYPVRGQNHRSEMYTKCIWTHPFLKW